MTRETKIGLLVGLAFIIVLGILIADYSVSSMQPPQAPLMNAARDVQASNNAMGQRRLDPLPERAGDVRVPLVHPVELDSPRRSTSGNSANDGMIRLAPPDRNPRDLIVRDNPLDNDTGSENHGMSERNDPVRETEVVHGGGNSDEVERPLNMSALREYKAEPGDTVYRMARKFLGSGSQENQDAIVSVNPALKANPNKIVAGATYKIPAKEEPVRGGSVTLPAPPAAPAAEETVSYTTRPGDSLWKIATSQCGSGSMATVNRIKELNKDVIKGDAVKLNVTLKLPKKAN